MKRLNSDIRTYAFENDVKLYQIAQKMGIHYVTLNAKLRKLLSTEEKKKIIDIIEELKKEK